MSIHRNIWIKNYGSIEIDANNRSYEIHHIDGNNKNNSIDNLKKVSIEEHYNIHHSQGDYGACMLIAKRMKLPVDYIQNIQKGKKRPGIGGTKKGSIPWNKDKPGYKLNVDRKNKQFSSKLQYKIVIEIRKKFESEKSNLPNIGKKLRNGKKLTAERIFSKKYHSIYGLTENGLYSIIINKTWGPNVKIKQKI